MIETAYKDIDRACAYLRKFNIDPDLVAEQPHPSHYGYWGFALTKAGKKIRIGSDTLKEWHDWPKGFDFNEFIEQGWNG